MKYRFINMDDPDHLILKEEVDADWYDFHRESDTLEDAIEKYCDWRDGCNESKQMDDTYYFAVYGDDKVIHRYTIEASFTRITNWSEINTSEELI